ncbi:unnamed protein product [Paramecium pentaurelia]|uniref:Transmembrane protein n=1 Tax=Paramecium pentaurelia TaxID=43138 RepID=A0A8S1VRW0_9CILI|nr:unnamed protein product [Paramecium pentaurelia]
MIQSSIGIQIMIRTWFFRFQLSVMKYQYHFILRIHHILFSLKITIISCLLTSTFQCQLGEFLNQTTGGCMISDKFQNQYQVTRKALNCSYKDDTQIRLIESSMIELRLYYWRTYNNSQNIEYCHHFPKNCQCGWKPGDKSCIVGHIGALCEQCDLYNTRGQGSFYLCSAYQCLNCNITIYNILSITFVILWTLLSTLNSASSTSRNSYRIYSQAKIKIIWGQISNQKNINSYTNKTFDQLLLNNFYSLYIFIIELILLNLQLFLLIATQFQLLIYQLYISELSGVQSWLYHIFQYLLDYVLQQLHSKQFTMIFHLLLYHQFICLSISNQIQLDKLFLCYPIEQFQMNFRFQAMCLKRIIDFDIPLLIIALQFQVSFSMEFIKIGKNLTKQPLARLGDIYIMRISKKLILGNNQNNLKKGANNIGSNLL